MIIWRLTGLLVALTGLMSVETYAEGSPGTSRPSPSASPSVSSNGGLASYKERLGAAESVEVQTDILGLVMGSSLDAAHAKLDSLSDPSKPPSEEGGEKKQGEAEHRVLWQLAKTDFSSIYVKADDKDQIVYISGFIRPGKEIPFSKIGQLEKAPLHDENNVAWDVVRPNKPLIRVVARGANQRASSITIFVVKRPAQR